MGRARRPTTFKYLLDRRLTEEEKRFILLVMVAGLTAAEAYRVSFKKFDIAPSTAASSGSRLLNDSKIQEAMWKIWRSYKNGNLILHWGPLRFNRGY